MMVESFSWRMQKPHHKITLRGKEKLQTICNDSRLKAPTITVKVLHGAFQLSTLSKSPPAGDASKSPEGEDLGGELNSYNDLKRKLLKKMELRRKKTNRQEARFT
jgi:hypothetical protein